MAHTTKEENSRIHYEKTGYDVSVCVWRANKKHKLGGNQHR